MFFKGWHERIANKDVIYFDRWIKLEQTQNRWWYILKREGICKHYFNRRGWYLGVVDFGKNVTSLLDDAVEILPNI